jgi:hypothetical protein
VSWGWTGRVRLIAAAVLWAGCQPVSELDPHGEGEGGAAWVAGTVGERFQMVGEQFAGFSATMFEVAHRYRELHWAVEDGNLAYADYQAEKIGDAIERGIVRRPARAASARALFLDGPLPAFRDALADGNEEQAARAFEELTAACNQCHVAEEFGFVVVGPPAERSTVVQPEGAAR